MKTIIDTTAQGIFGLVANAQEVVKPLSTDQRSTLLHECDDTIKRERGTVKGLAAEIVRAAILVENGN